MQFLSSLLGGSGNTIVTSALALGVVIVLIVLGLWALKFVMKTGVAMRPQGRRVQVVEQVQIDSKRQLLVIRRDNVEHLVMTGGPQDVVIESGIPASERPALPTRRMPVPPAAEEATKAPAPVAAVATPEPPRPTVLRPHIERLRDFARPGVRKGPSLRHTGLLRPVSVGEPAVIPMPPIAGDNSGRLKADSATTPLGIDTNGRTALGAQGSYGDDGATDRQG
jgi:flagellar biogenesis protein FliO